MARTRVKGQTPMQLHYTFEIASVATAFAQRVSEAIESQYHIETEWEWEAADEDETYAQYVEACKATNEAMKPFVDADNTSVTVYVPFRDGNCTNSHNVIVLASLVAAHKTGFGVV